jgi:hypothetical protein
VTARSLDDLDPGLNLLSDVRAPHAQSDLAETKKEGAMYNMFVRPTVGFETDGELAPSARSAHWRGFLAVIGLFGAAAFAIAAPLADRQMVPATFVDQIQAAFGADTLDERDYTLPETAGEPAITLAPTACAQIECG